MIVPARAEVEVARQKQDDEEMKEPVNEIKSPPLLLKKASSRKQALPLYLIGDNLLIAEDRDPWILQVTQNYFANIGGTISGHRFN